MGVQVDEAGRDEQARRIDLAGGVTVEGAEGRDRAADDGDVAHVGLPAEAVNDGAVADDQVVNH